MCSEASFLNSGFGTYANEILKRLHATNKYEIAEFASYGKVNDPQDSSIQWRYYANAVMRMIPEIRSINHPQTISLEDGDLREYCLISNRI